MKTPENPPASLDYGMHLRHSLVSSSKGQTPQQIADSLNLLEDIMNPDRSIDDVVDAFLNAKTPKVYGPLARPNSPDGRGKDLP